MSGITEAMLEHPFFKDFKASHVKLLSKCASSMHFAAGSYIFHDGETADRLHLIQTGRIAVELEMVGHDPMAIMTVDAGGVVGWSWLFPPYRWHFSARVVQDTSAIVLDAKSIMLKCKEDYQLGYELMWQCANIMGERLHATRTQLISLMSY